MNDHKKRLLNDMKKSIDDYRHGNLPYAVMVGNLEGALDAGEFKDKGFLASWYTHWTPLEICNATGGNATQLSDCEDILCAFTDFIEVPLGKDHDL